MGHGPSQGPCMVWFQTIRNQLCLMSGCVCRSRKRKVVLEVYWIAHGIKSEAEKNHSLEIKEESGFLRWWHE